jgi:hypothetical protein
VSDTSNIVRELRLVLTVSDRSEPLSWDWNALLGIRKGESVVVNDVTHDHDTCDWCGAPMTIRVRGHHHTEEGVDVTTRGSWNKAVFAKRDPLDTVVEVDARHAKENS